MAILLLRRLASMILIMVAVSLIIFTIYSVDKLNIAGQVLGPYSSQEQREVWLEDRGYNEPFLLRYLAWVGLASRPEIGDNDRPTGERVISGVLQGDFGRSNTLKVEVSEVLWSRLANTGILAGLTFLFMIPIALTLGVVAGMKEGSFQDRATTVFAVLTTSVPEFASATFLIAIFVYGLGFAWAPANLFDGIGFVDLVLPVAVLVIYDMGYVARMTRASMAEVMTSQYIRTAILKGVPRRQVIMKHALRNALIAPFTVIVLQLNWLLSGVIVVEVAFNYKGFGELLFSAATNKDLFVVQAATLVAVFVAVASQLISDIGYTYLNPRIRFS
jgi:peptide/nickel transport system permease protein